MLRRTRLRCLCFTTRSLLPLWGLFALIAPAAADWAVIGWNDLGMHCMDSDYGVFSILPPYNTVQAQLIDRENGLVTAPGSFSITYEAIPDPQGSENRTSIGKTGFWDHVADLYGASPPPDMGLAGHGMPGAANLPQDFSWDGTWSWFSAEGIPITPYDDAFGKNPYPMMRLVARDGGGGQLAETRIVLPVSDEMDCSLCHASGAPGGAEPPSGWVWDPDPERDYRLNVLLLHDDLHATDPEYLAALALAGYDPDGLHPTVVVSQTPILCARCHLSNALPGTGLPDVTPLTTAVHDLHADVVDPTNGMTLDASENRTACYRCHPGSETQCLRGAMGAAVASDGALAIQCQDCHGSMSLVGDENREGWLDQPTCQSCHTGTAVENNGQIRYLSVFEESGQVRQAVNQTFATNPDVPAAGFDLYRFSTGHGGVACLGCHGSPHAIFPAAHGNDNIQNELLQGHAGTLSECTACHQESPETDDGGPHGLHPIGQDWVGDHEAAGGVAGAAACRACHGLDHKGTVLSYSQADWTASTPWGPRHFWRGFRIGCWACHNGPEDDDPSPNTPAQVDDADLEAQSGSPAPLELVASDPDGDTLTLRIVSQPAHGTVGLVGTTATYYPAPGYSGPDLFTFAAWDGWTDSNLGTIDVNVVGSIFADAFESGDLSAWSSSVP